MRIGSCSQNHRHITARGLTLNQALAVMHNLQKSGAGYVLDVSINTVTPVIGLHQFVPLSYYTIASSRPLAFFEFLRLVSENQAELLKAWVALVEGEEIDSELSFSASGVSLDGAFHPAPGLEHSEHLVRNFVPAIFRERDCLVGRNSGAFFMQLPSEKPGLDIVERAGKKVMTDEGREDRSYFYQGAINKRALLVIAQDLIRAGHFRSLEISQPVLSAVVEKLGLYRDLETGLFSYDLTIEPCSDRITANISALL